MALFGNLPRGLADCGRKLGRITPRDVVALCLEVFAPLAGVLLRLWRSLQGRIGQQVTLHGKVVY
jgi:hypothetical protein